ncbi:hypothetical protein V3C99_015380, partial [Haemonchus contortus]
RSARRAVNR